MQLHITHKSRNTKTGPIPVTTTSSESCPHACPLKDSGACYAKSGPLALHWAKVSRGDAGASWAHGMAAIASLPDGALWRHNQAGDLPGVGDAIDASMMRQLIAANTNKRGFTYTHKPTDGAYGASNRELIAEANRQGFTVNLSADTLKEADELAALDIGPVVVVVSRDHAEKSLTPAGRKVIVCPAQTREGVTCASCGLCSRVDREVIVGFRAHGVNARKAEAIAA